MPPIELVNHPDHYQGCSELTRPILLQLIPSFMLDRECVEVCESLGFSHHISSAVEYLWRAGQKTPNPTEDLSKAKWWFNRHQQVYGASVQYSEIVAMIENLIAVAERNQ